MITNYFTPITPIVDAIVEEQAQTDTNIFPSDTGADTTNSEIIYNFESCNNVGKTIRNTLYPWLNWGGKGVHRKYLMVCSICYGKTNNDAKNKFCSVSLKQMASRELDKHEASSDHQVNKASLSKGTVLTEMLTKQLNQEVFRYNLYFLFIFKFINDNCMLVIKLVSVPHISLQPITAPWRTTLHIWKCIIS